MPGLEAAWRTQLEDMVTIEHESTSLEQVAAVSRGAAARLSERARSAISKGRAALEGRIREGRPIYGVSTGFGRLAGTRVSNDQVEALQRNLLFSHACGSGPPLPHRVVRVMMFLRAASLSSGRSGVRTEPVELLLA
ncbi:aromatic amino acid lyase, partial [Candidatus Fermentibacterales bacterium]|nr:aromatic amino acid lyase [Candidatus Fermentibacterales bacterium]